MINKLLQPGETLIGRYKIIDYVAEGGMQQVFSATDSAFNRVVAVKVPKSNSAEKRFERSAQVSARITHANVAKTLDYFEKDGRAFLVEELIDGMDLSKALESNFFYLDPHLAAHFVHLFAKGVAAAHHADVVHRDLKPSNLMVDAQLNMTMVKITDFGIAKMAESEIEQAIEGGTATLTNSTTAVGTLPYMAPEMIDKDKPVGKAADVWAIGAILYRVLSGQTPFGSGFRAIPAILAAKLPPQPSILTSKVQFQSLGLDLWKIVTACLEADASSRPTADDLVGMCSRLCYSDAPRFAATVDKTRVKGAYGFLTGSDSVSYFFHEDSCYGETPKVGDRVLISAFAGNPSKRAFPILRIKPEVK
jgi:serine/threonine protein kinase